MSTDAAPREVAAIGAQPLIAGFALAGVRTHPAVGADEVRQAWCAVAPRAAVVILTADAADVLGPARTAARSPLTVVMPA